jgi:hypothetical protein
MTKKETTLVFVIGISIVLMFMGMVLGPYSWIVGGNHFAILEDFQENGIKTTGTITYIKNPPAFPASRYESHYIDLIYPINDTTYVTAENIEAIGISGSKLKMNQELTIYYKPGQINEVILLRSYEEDLTLTRNPVYGKWLTLISYSLFIGLIGFVVVWVQRKKKARF